MKQGYLVLETGEVFEGSLIGKEQESVGEVVFNTSMTGYQEIITDPSYAGQIITFCYPLIGNYGINIFDNESIQPAAKGVVIGNMCEDPSHFQATMSLSEQLEQAGVTGLTGVDTRALVKTIRKHGTLKGIITNQLQQSEPKIKQDTNIFWVERVSTNKIVSFKKNGPHVVLIDYGYKKSILHALMKEGCSVSVVPYHYSYEQITALNPDGVVLSNGPGNPMELKNWFQEIKKITQTFPTLGICLGHQLIALAHGAKTKKLAYGHRGGNHPVKDLETGKVMITSQNHGYVVIDESVNQEVFQVTFQNVNDKTVEGLKHRTLPVQTVQFHPEAHPGPSDTAYVFSVFIQQVSVKGGALYAVT
jgi:carbamoyl-phosphate synthase small subunit